MKRLTGYILVVALLGGCSAEDSLIEEGQEVGQSTSTMSFSVMSGSFEEYAETRAVVDIDYEPDAPVTERYGWYKKTEFPGTEFFLTSFHHDRTDLYQYYFQDLILDDVTPEGATKKTEWDATDWFWPIQGTMEFMSYWCPTVYGFTKFTTLTNYDGSLSSHMKVDCHGGSFTFDGTKYEVPGLDGYTDFLYIATDDVKCPQMERYPLAYKHGLAWLTLSLQAEVKTKNPVTGLEEYDEAETNKLIENVKVQKIVIENTSRKGEAYIVPGVKLAWLINDDDIYDQVYTRPSLEISTPGHYGYFDWKQEKDASLVSPEYVITLSHNEQYLGLYRPKYENICTGNGLLLIPQHKTAITVYYTVKDGKIVTKDGVTTTQDLEVAQKFELRDNNLEWEPGLLYHYDILFNSKAEDLHSHIELTETTYHIAINLENKHYDSEAFGQLLINSTTYSNPVFILDPYHTQGSPFEDEMDFIWGGNVF